MRRQKDQQVRLPLRGGSLLEGPAEEGDITQTGDLCLGIVVLVADEAADHDSLIVVYNHCSFRRTFRGRDRTDFRFGDKGRDFLRQLEADRPPLTDLGGNAQGDTGIFELDRKSTRLNSSH